MKLNLLVAFLLALPFIVYSQTEAPATTTEGEVFKDPFAEPQQEDFPESAPEIPQRSLPPVQRAPAPVETPLYPPQQQQPTYQQPSSEPFPQQRAPQPRQAPRRYDYQRQQQQQVPTHKQPIYKEEDDFRFPEFDRGRGPVSSSVKRQDDLESYSAVGKWNLGLGVGAGLNLNRRPNQFHVEAFGGYRLAEHSEMTGIFYGRFMSDTLIGLLAMYNYILSLSSPPTDRMELLIGGGFGVTFRAPKGSFKETRFPLRIQTTFNYFITPNIAFYPALAFETFLFAVDGDGGRSLFRGGGPPTQLILTTGVRFDL